MVLVYYLLFLWGVPGRSLVANRSPSVYLRRLEDDVFFGSGVKVEFPILNVKHYVDVVVSIFCLDHNMLCVLRFDESYQ